MAPPNSVLSTVLPILRDKLIDNSFTSTPLFRALDAAGSVKRVTGGQRIEQPVILGQHSQITNLSGSGFNPVSLAVTDPFRKANFEWANFVQPIVVSEVETLRSKGDLAVVSILEEKMKNVMISLRTAMSDRIFSGQTAILPDLQTLNGMGTATLPVDTTGWMQGAAFGFQTTNTVGGLSKGTFAADNWQNQVFDSGGAFDLAHLDTLMIRASLYHPNGKRPDIIFMSPNCFSAFQALLTDAYRYQDVSGRDGLVDSEMVAMWRGAKVYVDNRLGFANAAGDDVSAYAISSDMNQFYFDQGGEFDVSELTPIPGTATLTARVLVSCQLVTGHLASSALLLNAES